MAVQTSTLNLAADAIGDAITHLSLHSTDGGTTGTDELTGGSYAQQLPSYAGAAVAGVDDLATSVTFGGPAVATDATHLGFWSSTTWRGSVALAVPKVDFVDPDTLEVTSAPIQVAIPS